jgi:hypothetical protein
VRRAALHSGRDQKPELQRELSWFLIAYLIMFLGVLLGVHLLQAGWETSGGASRSPSASKQAAAAQAVTAQAKARSTVP